MFYIFLNIDDEVDNNEHQLLIKWCLVIKQIIETGEGSPEFINSNLVLGIYRIVFDKNLSENLRKRYADILVKLQTSDDHVNSFVERLLKAMRYPKTLNDLEAQDYVNIIDKEVIHPTVILTHAVSKFYTDKYEEKMMESLKRLENDDKMLFYQ